MTYIIIQTLSEMRCRISCLALRCLAIRVDVVSKVGMAQNLFATPLLKLVYTHEIGKEKYSGACSILLLG